MQFSNIEEYIFVYVPTKWALEEYILKMRPDIVCYRNV